MQYPKSSNTINILLLFQEMIYSNFYRVFIVKNKSDKQFSLF